MKWFHLEERCDAPLCSPELIHKTINNMLSCGFVPKSSCKSPYARATIRIHIPRTAGYVDSIPCSYETVKQIVELIAEHFLHEVPLKTGIAWFNCGFDFGVIDVGLDMRTTACVKSIIPFLSKRFLPGIPKDMKRLLALTLWEARFDPTWDKTVGE